MRTKIVSLLVLAAAMAAPVVANTVIDTFNDVIPKVGTFQLTNNLPVYANLHGGGVGWTGGFSPLSGDYEQNTGVILLKTNDQVVSLVNYVSGQSGSKRFSFAGSTNASVLRRAQTRHTPTLAIANTIWFSCIVTLYATNGDAGILFNPNLDGAGTVKNNAFTGYRVGVGSVYAPYTGSGGATNRSGSLGIGPIDIKTGPSTFKEGDNFTITNWSAGVVGNGIEIDHVVPTNGTPGLVLGCIYYDTNNNNYPRIDVWYNPDVPNAASLPAPTISYTDTNGSLTLGDVNDMGVQMMRSSTAVQHESMDNLKVSDEANGFDIVYLNAALPTPIVGVAAPVPVGSRIGPTNLVFSVYLDRLASSPVTVSYLLSGTATNGYNGIGGFTNADYTDSNFNTGTLSSSVTIPTGQSNALVTIYVLNDGLPEGNQSVILTALAGSGYIVGLNPSAAGTIMQSNAANVSLQYMFESTLAPQVWDPNLAATPAVTTGIGGASYDGTYFVSGAYSFLVRGNVTTNDEADAVADGNYMGITVGPVMGKGMTLTNFQFDADYGNAFNLSGTASMANIVVRSSLDNFGSHLTNFVLTADPNLPGTFTNLNVILGDAFTNLPGAVEFRLYFYDDTDDGQIGLYPIGVDVDNLYVSGSTFPALPGVQRVAVVATITNAALPSTWGQFTLTRYTSDASNPLTVNYYFTGTAGNGAEYSYLGGVTNFAAGQTNVIIPVIPLDDNVPEGIRTVTLTLIGGTSYGVLLPGSDTVYLAPNGDLPGLVTYYFDENNNGAGSLAAVAAGQTTHGSQVVLHNAAAGSGMGLFGANGGAGVGHGYGTSSPFEGASCLYLNNSYLTTDEADAVTASNYFSFTLSPASGYSMILTNFTTYSAYSGVGQLDTVVLRSSADNFTADLGSFIVPGTSAITWNPYSIPLSITNDYTGTEFRLYVFTTQPGGTFFRLDQTAFQGGITAGPTAVAPVVNTLTVGGSADGSPVTVNFAAGATDPSSAFFLQSSTNVSGPFIDDNSAVVTGSGGMYQITTTVNGDVRFYRIRR